MTTRTRKTDAKTLNYAVAGPERPVPVYRFPGKVFYESPGTAYRNAPPLPFQGCEFQAVVADTEITAIPELVRDARLKTARGRLGTVIHVERTTPTKYLMIFYMDDGQPIHHTNDFPLGIVGLEESLPAELAGNADGTWEVHISTNFPDGARIENGGITVDADGGVCAISTGPIYCWDETGSTWTNVVSGALGGYGLTHNPANDQFYYIWDNTELDPGVLYRYVRDGAETPPGFETTQSGGSYQVLHNPPNPRNLRALAIGDDDSDYDLYVLDVGDTAAEVNRIYGTRLDETGGVPQNEWVLVKEISSEHRYKGMAVKGNNFYLAFSSFSRDTVDGAQSPIRIYNAHVEGHYWEFGDAHRATGLAFSGNNLVSLNAQENEVYIYNDALRVVNTSRVVPKRLFVDADGDAVDITNRLCDKDDYPPDQAVDWIVRVKEIKRAQQTAG